MARAAPESRQQARSALAGDLSWGRLGRIALLQDTSEIFPSRSRKPAGTSRSSLWPSWGSCRASWGSFGASWGSFETSWVSFWASGGALGSLWGVSWGLQKPLKSLPEALPEAPRTGARFSNHFGGHFGVNCWLHFWTPRTSKIKVFVWNGGVFFLKNREARNGYQRQPGPESVLGPSWARFWALLGHSWDPNTVKKATWNLRRLSASKKTLIAPGGGPERLPSDFSSKNKPGYHGTGSARGERASSTASDAGAARAARGTRAGAPALGGAAAQEQQEQPQHQHSKRA